MCVSMKLLQRCPSRSCRSEQLDGASAGGLCAPSQCNDTRVVKVPTLDGRTAAWQQIQRRPEEDYHDLPATTKLLSTSGRRQEVSSRTVQ